MNIREKTSDLNPFFIRVIHKGQVPDDDIKRVRDIIKKYDHIIIEAPPVLDNGEDIFGEILITGYSQKT